MGIWVNPGINPRGYRFQQVTTGCAAIPGEVGFGAQASRPIRSSIHPTEGPFAVLAIETTVPLPLDQAEAAVRATLADNGFGVLTEIDVAATLKAKLGVDRPALKILGACNPAFANDALGLDPSAALVLPCNVVLEPGPDGGTRISAVDPRQLMPEAAFAELAESAAAKLTAALRAVGA
jgi:uncharacterized protein (DUF302 family)